MKILNFPNLRQTYEWDCGAKAIQSVLIYYGIDETESIIMKIAHTTRSGTPISGIKKVAKKYDLNYRAGRMTISDIKCYLDKKIPIILLLQAWTRKNKVDWATDWQDGHYVVAIGYDKSKIYFADPGSIKRTYLTNEELKIRWHDASTRGTKYINWGIALFGKKIKYDLRKFEQMN